MEAILERQGLRWKIQPDKCMWYKLLISNGERRQIYMLIMFRVNKIIQGQHLMLSSIWRQSFRPHKPRVITSGINIYIANNEQRYTHFCLVDIIWTTFFTALGPQASPTATPLINLPMLSTWDSFANPWETLPIASKGLINNIVFLRPNFSARMPPTTEQIVIAANGILAKSELWS